MSKKREMKHKHQINFTDKGIEPSLNFNILEKFLTFQANGGPILGHKIRYGHLNDLFRQIGPL